MARCASLRQPFIGTALAVPDRGGEKRNSALHRYPLDTIAGGSVAEAQQLAVLVAPGEDSGTLVEHARKLAEGLGLAWEAVHVEVPSAGREPDEGHQVSEALKFASSQGAIVSTTAAATIADGLAAHFAGSSVRHLVIGRRQAQAGRLAKSLLGRMLAVDSELVIHVFPADPAPQATSHAVQRATESVQTPIAYLIAVGAAALTLAVAELFRLFVPVRSLDLLFLLPVIAVASRLGLRPALLTSLLSVLSYNFFLMAPSFQFEPGAPQNVIMSIALVGVAGYTSLVTGKLRARLVLSDRSARENAEVAKLAQHLTRDSDWESTALTVCKQVAAVFDVHTAMFREVAGDLVLVAACPNDPEFGPVDRLALDWCWKHAEETGVGTASLSACNWQFQPLATSLGTLAVLAIARDDGRDPVPEQRKILLSTMVAQAALAHERLRLEERGGLSPN